MTRRIFSLNEPFREIQNQDTTKTFQSKLLDACGATLASMIEENIDSTHVWVYDANDEILAVLAFEDLEDEFHIEIISNNFAISEYVLEESKPGSSLYEVMEDLARKNNISKITLDSIPDRVGYWRNYGFKQTGIPFDGKFCKLFPMEKNL